MNNGRYLYLLDLGDDEHIKYGIGTDFGRIQQHLRTYPGINLDNSYIVNSTKSKTIIHLEQEIKQIFGMSKKDLPEHFHGKDGHTEITKKEKLQDILEYIGFKQKYDVLGITYKVGIEIPATTNLNPQNKIPFHKDFISEDLYKLIDLLRYFTAYINKKGEYVIYANKNEAFNDFIALKKIKSAQYGSQTLKGIIRGTDVLSAFQNTQGISLESKLIILNQINDFKKYSILKGSEHRLFFRIDLEKKIEKIYCKLESMVEERPT